MLFKQVLKIRLIRNFSTTSSITVDQDELQKYPKYVHEWWDKGGPMKALHSMNKLRIPFIRDGLMNTNQCKPEYVTTSKPLKDISVLDVGCGGGILSVPLTRLGCNVTGIDISSEIVEMARNYADKENLSITYQASSIEDHAKQNIEKYDAIVSSEVIEHVTEKSKFVEACVKCLKPTGSIFFTSINKTVLANVLAIFLAESVFNLVPKGTHEYGKLCEPHKLQGILEDCNCKTLLVHGMFYNILTNTWSWSSDSSVNYALHAVKLKQSSGD